MAATFVAAAQAGDGQTAQVTTLSLTIPATAAAGDRAIVFVDSSDSALAFSSVQSGWSVIDGPRANGTSASTAIIEKTALVSGDVGSTFTLAWTTSGAARVVMKMLVFRGASTGAASIYVAQDTAATGSYVLPTGAASAGTIQIAAFERRRSGVTGTITVPSPYTTGFTNADPATAYAAGVNVYTDCGYVLSSAGGTVGGETGSSGVTSIGANYVVIIPTGPVQGSLAITSTGTLSLGASAETASGSLTLTSTGTLSLGGKPVSVGALAVTSTGTLTIGGTPKTTGSLAVTSTGTLTLFAGNAQGTLSITSTGTLALAPSSMTAKGSLSITSTGTLSLGGKPITNGILALTGVGLLTLSAFITTRLKWWDGAAWQPTVIRYWDGAAWQLATLRVWDGAVWA